MNGPVLAYNGIIADNAAASSFGWNESGTLRAAITTYYSREEMYLGLTSDVGMQFIITNLQHGAAHLHAPQTNPTLYGHSANSPATNPNEWWSITQDQTNTLFSLGTGIFSFVGSIGLTNFNEMRWYDDGANYVGFEAPALSADQIWTLPPADGISGDVLTTDGAGSLSWAASASEKTWAFMSRDASTGTNYIGGYYAFGSAADDFNPAITLGTANASYAAHVFLVQAAGASGGTDTVIRVSGTSIDDQGNRTAADTQDLTVDDAGAAGTYYETSKKWLGQVTITKISGPDLLCNYGFCKYWDNNNTNFRIAGIEATWLGAANDATPDILLRHHKATGWTYNAGAAPTPPAAVASMAVDHNTEIQIRNNEEGAWKRDDLATDVAGGTSEGTIIELVTTANRAYAIGNFLIRITPQ